MTETEAGLTTETMNAKAMAAYWNQLAKDLEEINDSSLEDLIKITRKKANNSLRRANNIIERLQELT